MWLLFWPRKCAFYETRLSLTQNTVKSLAGEFKKDQSSTDCKWQSMTVTDCLQISHFFTHLSRVSCHRNHELPAPESARTRGQSSRGDILGACLCKKHLKWPEHTHTLRTTAQGNITLTDCPWAIENNTHSSQTRYELPLVLAAGLILTHHLAGTAQSHRHTLSEGVRTRPGGVQSCSSTRRAWGPVSWPRTHLSGRAGWKVHMEELITLLPSFSGSLPLSRSQVLKNTIALFVLCVSTLLVQSLLAK